VVNFKRVPALTTGNFELTGSELARVAWRLPPALRGVKGRISAAGHFTTRGLTSQEMSAGLSGEAGFQLTDVSLGGFDPAQAFARAASLGPLQPDPGEAHFRSALLDLRIQGQRVILAPLQLQIGKTLFSIDGDYSFDGKANVYVHANASRIEKRVRMNQDSLAVGGLPWSAPSGASGLGAALLSSGRSSQLTGIQPPGHPFPPWGPPKIRMAGVHLAGSVRALAVVRSGGASTHP
jgi:hypothetical protein